MLSPVHHQIVEELLSDLAHAVKHHGVSKGREARYS
jgi:hypothetical protein